jgi:hypothetical protein
MNTIFYIITYNYKKSYSQVQVINNNDFIKFSGNNFGNFIFTVSINY